MTTVSREVLERIDALQSDYVYALDSKDMDGWLGSFDNPGSYICIAAENVANNLPLALMMDDCHERLMDRVTYITKVWAGTFEDYQTRHFIQRMKCEDAGNNTYNVETNYSILYTPEQGQTDILVTGKYVDTVTINGTAKFTAKQAIMDTNVSPRYIVYPV
jgi:3-phenylpropionate/cinnamic acid dioxygenase small subunit